MNRVGAMVGYMLLAALAAILASCASPTREAARGPGDTVEAGYRSSDEELARLLVKLELRAHQVIARHYHSADEAHQGWLAQRRLLPAIVAGEVFREAVTTVTRGRAWVKMVVDEPRNLNNRGDSNTIGMLEELRRGKPSIAWRTRDAYYYAEPIKAEKECLLCHGQPKGVPDPFFPHYKKNGWLEGQTVGAVVARVGQTVSAL